MIILTILPVVNPNVTSREALQRKLEKTLAGEIVEYTTDKGEKVVSQFERCALDCHTGHFRIAFILGGKRYEDSFYRFIHTYKKLTSRNKVAFNEVFEYGDAMEVLEKFDDLKPE